MRQFTLADETIPDTGLPSLLQLLTILYKYMNHKYTDNITDSTEPVIRRPGVKWHNVQ